MNPGRILVRLPNWLGDGVMAVPALRALRRRFSTAELVLWGRGAFEPLLASSGLFDRFLPRAKEDPVGQLRQLGPDIAVIFPHSVRSALEPWRAQVPIRIGYAREGRGRFLTHSLTPHRTGDALIPVPMHSQYLELVGILGADGHPSEGDLRVSDEAAAAAQEWLEARGLPPGEPIVGWNPGASFGPSKVYPPDLLGAAIDRAVEGNLGRALVLCGPGEEELAREVASHCRQEVVTAADDPPPLDVLKGILQQLTALVTTDSGPRHVATALGVPTVVLMGPTDPRFTAARLERSIVLRVDVPCGPCHLKECPLDHRCLREIAPETVVSSVVELVGAGSATGG